MTTALVIPASGPLYELELGPDAVANGDILSKTVGGILQFLPLPPLGPAFAKAAAYINDEGKFHPDRFKPNPRATTLMMPGAHLAPDDYIIGTMVLVGMDAEGVEADLPQEVTDWVRAFCG